MKTCLADDELRFHESTEEREKKEKKSGKRKGKGGASSTAHTVCFTQINRSALVELGNSNRVSSWCQMLGASRWRRSFIMPMTLSNVVEKEPMYSLKLFPTLRLSVATRIASETTSTEAAMAMVILCTEVTTNGPHSQVLLLSR